MGDEQKVGYQELLAASKAAFEEVADFTVAVEEEFALLDPATLELVNRFEDVQQAAQGTELEPHLVGELIASEVEVRTGRCETFAECAERLGDRRAQLRTLVDSLGMGLSSVGTHPWSPWQEQRIIDTPHYRQNDELLETRARRDRLSAVEVDQLAREAVANRAPEVLLEQPMRPRRQRLALVERARNPRGQRVDERRERARLGELRLRVADARLDRRELEMRANAPPDLRVLGDRTGLVEEADVVLPIVPAAEPVGDAAAREHTREDLRARRVQVREHAFDERRARGQREQLGEEVP